MAALLCAKCKQTKPSSDFTNGEQRREGYRRCRACVSATNQAYQKTRPAQKRRADMTSEELERYRGYDRARSPRQNADSWFRYRYGLTVDQIDTMIEEQYGLCAICNRPETKVDPRTGKVRRLCVDHDHRTGLPRRMLCQRCNWVLAHVDDDIEMLEKFVSYLKAFTPRT